MVLKSIQKLKSQKVPEDPQPGKQVSVQVLGEPEPTILTLKGGPLSAEQLAEIKQGYHKTTALKSFGGAFEPVKKPTLYGAFKPDNDKEALIPVPGTPLPSSLISVPGILLDAAQKKVQAELDEVIAGLDDSVAKWQKGQTGQEGQDDEFSSLNLVTHEDLADTIKVLTAEMKVEVHAAVNAAFDKIQQETMSTALPLLEPGPPMYKPSADAPSTGLEVMEPVLQALDLNNAKFGAVLDAIKFVAQDVMPMPGDIHDRMGHVVIPENVLWDTPALLHSILARGIVFDVAVLVGDVRVYRMMSADFMPIGEGAMLPVYIPTVHGFDCTGMSLALYSAASYGGPVLKTLSDLKAGDPLIHCLHEQGPSLLELTPAQVEAIKHFVESEKLHTP